MVVSFKTLLKKCKYIDSTCTNNCKIYLINSSYRCNHDFFRTQYLLVKKLFQIFISDCFHVILLFFWLSFKISWNTQVLRLPHCIYIVVTDAVQNIVLGVGCRITLCNDLCLCAGLICQSAGHNASVMFGLQFQTMCSFEKSYQVSVSV